MSSSSSKQSFSSKLKYSFDNFMSKGGFSIFSALMFLFIGAIVVIAILRFIVNLVAPQENMANVFDQWWLSFLQIADGGAIGEDTDSNILNRVVGIIALFLGMVLFSSLVAFITSQFEAKMEELKKGKSEVIEKGHTLILGFSDRVLEIIRELIVANESEKDASVVVMANMDKTEMDDFFRDRIENRKSTRIVTRTGSTSSLQLLRRVAVDKAKSIIILNDVQEDASTEDKALADARVLKTIMAVIACTGEEAVPPILADLHLEANRQLAKNIVPEAISIIDEQSILAKLMVQTSRVTGLAHVYNNLVGFEGCEFYFHQPSEGFPSIKYSDLIFHYPNCSVIGIRKENGTVILNPAASSLVDAKDNAILIAEDDSMIKFTKQKMQSTTPSGKPASAQPKVIENQLIIGWSQKASIIVDEYSNYLVDGSKIDVIVQDITDDMKESFAEVQAAHPKIKITLRNDDIHDTEVLAALKPEQYDNVIILTADGGEAELRDSETIAKLLEFRHYFKKHAPKNVKTQLITEVADSENIEIIQEAGVKDFLISNQFVSKIYAQISQDPETLEIYEDLFRAEGSEVYIKPVNLFLSSLSASIKFGDLCAAAIQRNETCFGVRLKSEEEDADKNYGIYINPDKSKMFTLSDSDWLITLAEDES